MLAVQRKRTHPRHAVLFILVLCSCITAVRAQKSILRVLNADSLVGRLVNGVEYRELIGNVRIQQEKVFITCDRALQNITDNSAELTGRVVLTQDTLILKTDAGFYNGNTKTASSTSGVYLNDGHVTLRARYGSYETEPRRARFTSHVDVEDSTVRIFSDTLFYERDSAKAVASGRVLMTYKRDNSVIQGDSAIHYTERKISFFPQRPRLWEIDSVVVTRDSITNAVDSLRLDTLSIVADRMEAYRDSSNRFFALGNVEIVRRDLSARCAEALFFRNDSTIVLRGQPVLWYELNQMTGDSIAVFLANNRIERMSIVGNAFSLSQSKAAEKDTVYPQGRYDQTKGKVILIFFKNDKASLIRVERTAISLYYLYDDRALNGVRRESGDLIVIEFADGKAETIHTLGGIEGTYYPEKFVTGKESTYNLEGFEWKTDRPVQPPYPADTRLGTPKTRQASPKSG